MIKKENIFTIKKIPFYLLIFLTAIIPLQAFLLTWLREILSLSNFEFSIVSLWKEYILILLMLIAGDRLFKEKNEGFNLLRLDKIIIIFFILSIVYLIFFNLPLSQKLAGLRYDTEFLIFYFAVRFLNISIKEFKILVYTFLMVSLPVIIFGLLQISILPPEFMMQFGYSNDINVYFSQGVISTYGAVNPLLPDVYRIQSTLPGAIQFGSYLILVSSLFLCLSFYKKNIIKYICGLVFILSAWALYATNTRSAWIAFLAVLLLTIFYKIKNKKIFFGLAACIIIVVAASVGLFLRNMDNLKLQRIILHGEVRDDGQLYGSTQMHLEALNNNIEILKNRPFGSGIGFAGPASKYGVSSVITENWYLQIALELGIFGLVIFIVVISYLVATLNKIYRIAKDNFQKYLSLGLLLALVGLSINSLMLHTFSDTATVYPLFIFIGMLITLNQKELT